MRKIQNIITTGYLFLILVMFPLFYGDHYLNMAFYKWIFYLSVTMLFFGFLAVLTLLQGISCIFGKKQIVAAEIRRKILLPDILVIAYGISNVLTFMTCSERRAAWMGTDGWYMGFIAQMLFVITYLVFSFGGAWEKGFIWFQCIGSAVCFFIAICQRYGNDFLHLYWGMEAEVIRDYLSTIGNRSWFAGYVAAVFPMGLYFFWKAKKRSHIYLTGSYLFLAFSCIATMNTNSIYAALAAVLFVLGLMSIGSRERLLRLLLVVDLWGVACLVMSLLRLVVPDEVRLLRGISKVCLNLSFATTCTILLLVLTAGCFYYGRRFPDKRWRIEEEACARGIRIRVGIWTAGVALAVLLLLVLNTTGMLQKWFGITLRNDYLYFDNLWGDSRGFSWQFAARMYMELPLQEKLFGVGQDCFAFYAYSIPEYVKELRSFWGDVILANAHNEWLNSLICNGLLGGGLYLACFLSAACYCLKNHEHEQELTFISSAGLCIIGYVVNNFFGYQQASATAVIFIAMGVAMHLKKIRFSD